MGKKRVAEKLQDQAGGNSDIARGRVDAIRPGEKGQDMRAGARGARGVAHIQATYNNTIITIADGRGNAVAWASAGSIGFSGAKKATPYAAARVAEVVVEKLRKSGIQEVAVKVVGVGSGRESAIRSLANHGLQIVSVRDATPIPHNGPRPPKVRRV